VTLAIRAGRFDDAEAAATACQADPILPPTTIPPPTTVPPAPVVPPVFTGSPRYKLEAISFRADDESGIDWIGSDEPVFVFTSVDGAGSQRSVAQKFGDVDSGESRSFTTARCLVATCTTGVAGPLALTTQLVESDGGSAEEIRGKVSKAITTLQWVTKVFGWDASFLDGAIEDYLVSVFADDLMGSANLVWEQWELAQALPVVGATYTEVIHLGERGGDLPSWLDNPPDYTLRLRITRMADLPPVRTS
jgi:hypothetical protein